MHGYIHRGESQGESPSEDDSGIRSDPEVDPVSDDDTDIVGDEDDGEVDPTAVSLGQFGNPRTSDGVDETNSDPGDDTSADEHVGVLGCRHENTAENTKQRSKPDALLPPVLVTEPSSEEASKHRTEIVGGDQATVGNVRSDNGRYLQFDAKFTLAWSGW